MLTASRELSKKLGEISLETPSAEDLDKLLNECWRVWTAQSSIDFFTKKTLQRVPFVLFRTHQNGSSLANDELFISKYLYWLEESLSPKAFALLLDAYLANYNPEEPWFHPVRSCLGKIIQSSNSSPRINRLARRCVKYSFLEEDGPKQFGQMIFQKRADLQGFLADAGLAGIKDRQGFVAYAFQWFMADIRDRLTKSQPMKKDLLQSFLNFSRVNTTTLRFEKYRVLLIDSLLEPFENNDEPVREKELIFDFLITTFGDPRTQLDRWAHVSQVSCRVINRWLVKGTLEDFFNLLKKVAERDNDAKKMWRYRQAFWSAYLHKNVITQAWVILGKEARIFANRYLDLGRDKYGSLVGGTGVSRLHSVLLLEIGGLVVAEWSHNGKAHIWLSDERVKPIFHRREYDREELTNNTSGATSDSPPFIHSSSESGFWQKKISDYIRRHTNISMIHTEFMPRD